MIKLKIIFIYIDIQNSISINVIILDVFSVAYQQTNDEKDLEYAFFGIFDGHGGREAAQYSKVCSNKQKISYN